MSADVSQPVELTPVESGGAMVHCTDVPPGEFTCGQLVPVVCGRTVHVAASWTPGTFGRHVTDAQVEGSLTCSFCAAWFRGPAPPLTPPTVVG